MKTEDNRLTYRRLVYTPALRYLEMTKDSPWANKDAIVAVNDDIAAAINYFSLSSDPQKRELMSKLGAAESFEQHLRATFRGAEFVEATLTEMGIKLIPGEWFDHNGVQMNDSPQAVYKQRSVFGNGDTIVHLFVRRSKIFTAPMLWSRSDGRVYLIVGCDVKGLFISMKTVHLTIEAEDGERQVFKMGLS